MTSKLPALCPSETALLVVDVQVRFCAADWSAGIPAAVSKFIESVSAKGAFVVYTRTVGDLHLLPDNVRRFRQRKKFGLEPSADDPASALCPMFMPPSSVVVEKPIFDAFAYSRLKEHLLGKSIRNLLVAGIMTDVCVDATARRAVMEGFDTFILKDLVAAPPNQAENARRTLDFFRSYYGYVINSDEVLWSQFPGALMPR